MSSAPGAQPADASGQTTSLPHAFTTRTLYDPDAWNMDTCDFLTRRVLLRCDSTEDLYPVTTPSPIPHDFLASQHMKMGTREMEAFIREFRTTNELILKERNNSLSELRFEVYGLSRAIEKAQVINYEIKEVTIRGGKTTTETSHDTNVANKPSTLDHDKPVTPTETPAETEPQKTMKQVTNSQIPPIPFPQLLKKEKEEA
nr:ribonuclease H-like domain-containing protein [Tanacetum cinerariifolium]